MTTEAEETIVDSSSSKRCCGSCYFDGSSTAQGYNLLGTGRGPIIMTNIFLSTALIYLASEEVGCTEEVLNEDSNTTQWQVVEDCDERAFGSFKPDALITNIAVISGVLSALFMPVIGAIVDYTPHRWTVGIATAVLMMLVQGIQIGTNSSTWFAMAVLQAITGFFYQCQVLSVYAYLSHISRAVGQEKMTSFSSMFTMTQFSSQVLFLLIITALSIAFGWTDVVTAQASQAINTVTSSISFYFGWKLLPKIPPRHELPEGNSLLLQGFRQNWNTAVRIQRDYKKSIRWYLLALIFAETTANAFTLVAVVFLDNQVGFNGAQIGIFFLVTLVAFIPGGKLGAMITHRTDPNTSWRLSLFGMLIIAIIGGLTLNRDTSMIGVLAWGFVLGLDLGWHYPTENLFFSMIVPKGQEAELSGFFVYCTQIIGWTAPMIFSIMVERDVDYGVGVIAIACFNVVAIGFLSMAPSWPELVADARKHDPVVEVKPKESTDEEEDAHEQTQTHFHNEEDLVNLEVELQKE